MILLMKTCVDNVFNQLELPKDQWHGTAIGNISLQNRVNLGGAVSTVRGSDHYIQTNDQQLQYPNTPYFVFQYTLKGHGLFKKNKRFQRVKPGHAFCCIRPSDFCYKNDPTCPEYQFFWFTCNHPYIVSRLEKHPNLNNNVIKLSAQSPVIKTTIALINKCSVRKEADDLVIEELLFKWMFELESWAISERYPQKNRTYLLDYVRNYTLEHLATPFRISVMASAYGHSRSNFTHHFTATTGFSPAAYVNEIRLEESGKLLKETTLTVKEIASRTGFTNSNHFCKTFKKHFHTSAMNYRKHHSPMTKPVRRKLPD